MIQLTMQSAEGADNHADLFIDVKESVGITVLTKGGVQYDFDIEFDEWNLINEFVFEQIKKK